MVRTTSYSYSGNEVEARKLIGVANSQLLKLRNLMEFSGLKQYSLEIGNKQGARIRVSSVFGTEAVEVYFPTKLELEEKEKKRKRIMRGTRKHPWVILYIPNPSAPSDKYVKATRNSLEPELKFLKYNEPDAYGQIEGVNSELVRTNTPTVYSASSSVTSDITDGIGVDGWGNPLSQVVFKGHRTDLAVTSYLTKAGNIWEDSYTMITSGWDDWEMSPIIYRTADGPPETPTGPEGEFRITDGEEVTSQLFYFSTNISPTDIGGDSSWYKNQDERGFYIIKQTNNNISTGLHANAYEEPTFLHTEFSVVSKMYFVNNSDEIEIGSMSQREVDGVLENISGDWAQPHHVKAYKKEEILVDGIPEKDDVILVSYKVMVPTNRSLRMSYTSNLTQTKTGYRVISDKYNPEKEFDSDSIGVHELIEIPSTDTTPAVQLYCDGHFVLHMPEEADYADVEESKVEIGPPEWLDIWRVDPYTEWVVEEEE